MTPKQTTVAVTKGTHERVVALASKRGHRVQAVVEALLVAALKRAKA